MDEKKLALELKEIIAEIAELEVDDIKDDAHLVDDLKLDSLAALEILATMEKNYNIIIPEEDLEKFTTFKQVLDLAKEKLCRV